MNDDRKPEEIGEGTPGQETEDAPPVRTDAESTGDGLPEAEVSDAEPVNSELPDQKLQEDLSESSASEEEPEGETDSEDLSPETAVREEGPVPSGSGPEVPMPSEDDTAAPASDSDAAPTPDVAASAYALDSDADDFDYDYDYEGEEDVSFDGEEGQEPDDVKAFRSSSARSRSRSADARRRRRSRVRFQQIGLIVLGIAAVILIAVYAGGCYYFSSHFGFRTSLNGTDVSLMSEEQVEELLLDASEDYVLTIEGRNGVTDTITSSQIDLEPVFDGTIGALIEEQSAWSWPAALFSGAEYTSDSTAVFDESALDSVISELAFFEESNVVEPTDASYELGEDGVVIVAETEGADPILSAVTEAITVALNGFVSTLTLGDDCYRSAAITSDDEDLLAAVDSLNELLIAEITLVLTEDVTEELDPDILLEWISVSDGSYSFDETLIAAWVDELAEQYDTYGDDKEFQTTAGDIITVPGGNYGWLMDRESTTAAITELLNAGTGGTVEIVWTQTAEVFGEDDIGDTYIEADLDEQKVYLYVDGELVLETNCVSGKATDSSRATPNGVFRITYKKSPATLTGEGYESYVTYWMPFYYGYGFHDATWRSSFGGELYITGGSHGCINLPYSSAKTLYSYVYSGMPVFVYGGMSVSEAQAYAGTSSGSSEEEEEDTASEEDAAAQAELEAQIIEMAVQNYMATGMTEEEARAAVEADLAEQLAAQQAAAAAEAQAQAQSEASSSDTTE